MTENIEQDSQKKSKDCILVFCAHNDDNIVGAGGTIVKYAKEGKRVVTIIFSYGEMSHPHLREKLVIETRVKESHKAQAILGEDEVIYLGLKEGNFMNSARDKKIASKIEKIIKESNPSKIFVHSIDDPHPDHQAVYDILNSILDEIKYKGDVYSFDVWTLVNIRKRDAPKLVVDVTDTFAIKTKAFKVHKSQKVARVLLTWSMYLKAILNGINNGVKYAEVFYKIR
ncbi:MAG: PIG-L deacetylase family protein [Nanoarchaeota archaeon]|nr:PIG-L deacetylase family protein [Nanoarchaeota archaeon]